VPFFYNRSGNKTQAKSELPPKILDLSAANDNVWHRMFWDGIQKGVFDANGFILKAPAQTYRRNTHDYQTGHMLRALSILSVLKDQDLAGPLLSDAELNHIQARLMLAEKRLGGLVDDRHLDRVYEKESRLSQDFRGQNWELLRQRSEAEGLYFEPLTLPDGSATHALIWVARTDLEQNKGRRFNGKFLNISNPWSDSHLVNWQGYTETRYFDSENRRIESPAPGGHSVELIPLALYGLDHPRIPALLVDFRSSFNPKRREASRRLLEDVARNILSLSRFSNPYYMVAAGAFDFTLHQWGVDINQPSRLRAYSQLKLLLSLNDSLSGELRGQIAEDLEHTSVNPLENDAGVEMKVARNQYNALLAYAKDPNGLAAQISRDRSEEAWAYSHGRTGRGLFQAAKSFSLGLYKHRETATPDSMDNIDFQRTLDYHERFLRKAANSSPQIEITSSVDEVKRSLSVIRDSASASDSNTARVVALVFDHTKNGQIRSLALDCLYQINDSVAKNELLRIYQDQNVEAEWRRMSGKYLRLAIREQQRIAPSDAKIIVRIDEQ
jgi:hypothetical protein